MAFRMTRVSFDNDAKSFPARIDLDPWGEPQTRNGWVVPRFTRETVDEIREYINTCHGYYPSITLRLEWRGDVIWCVWPEPDEPDTECGPDHDGLYPLGAGDWEWGEVD